MRLISAGFGSMSDKEGEKDADNESLSDWTLVNQEEANQDENNDEDLEESSEAAIGPPKEDEEQEDSEEDSESEEEEEGAAAVAAPVAKSGSIVEEIKVSSGAESSDIETLDYSGLEDYPDHYQIVYNKGTLLTLQNIQFHNYKTEYAVDADAESLSSTESPEEKVRKRRSRKPEATQDEETDLSLASSPSLPDDLPAIRPEPQYIHTPHQELNSRLNLIVALTLACVLGLGIGHFLGWSSRTLWEENLNAAQIISNLEVENEALQAQILTLQVSNLEPIKIKGKEGREARELRERITQLISDNEDMRLAIARVQYNSLPDSDRGSFNRVVQENHHFRTSVAKLKHLGPDLDKLKYSIELLEQENKELVASVAKIRYEQPMPRELKSVVKEMESVKQAVVTELQKKKPSSNLHSAKSYLVFMSQVLSAFNSFNDDEVGLIDKVDLARDVFSLVVPKGVKLPHLAQEKVVFGRSKFKEIKESLQTKWKQLKELTKPENIAEIGQSTLSKMNRVIVNVVNKIKDIAHMTILKQNKKPIDLVISTLADKINILDEQFDKTWKSLQTEVPLPQEDKEEIFGPDYDDEPADEENKDGEDDDDEDENMLLAGAKNNDKKETPNKSKIEDEEKLRDLEIKKHKLMREEAVKQKIEIKEKQRFEKEKEDFRKKTKKAVKEEISKNIKSVNKEEKKGKKLSGKKKELVDDPVKKNVDITGKKEDVKTFSKPQMKGKAEKNTERPKFHVKEVQKADEPEPDGRYFKGQYNKLSKLKLMPEEDSTDKKYFKRKEDEEEEEDDEDDEETEQTHHKNKHDMEGGGLKRLWEKPQNKKSSSAETNGTKKLFIKRRGKKGDLGKGDVDSEGLVGEFKSNNDAESYQYSNYIVAEKYFQKQGKKYSQHELNEGGDDVVKKRNKMKEKQQRLKNIKSTIDSKIIDVQEEKQKIFKNKKYSKKAENLIKKESKLQDKKTKLAENEEKLHKKMSKFLENYSEKKRISNEDVSHLGTKSGMDNSSKKVKNNIKVKENKKVKKDSKDKENKQLDSEEIKEGIRTQHCYEPVKPSKNDNYSKYDKKLSKSDFKEQNYLNIRRDKYAKEGDSEHKQNKVASDSFNKESKHFKSGKYDRNGKKTKIDYQNKEEHITDSVGSSVPETKYGPYVKEKKNDRGSQNQKDEKKAWEIQRNDESEWQQDTKKKDLKHSNDNKKDDNEDKDAGQMGRAQNRDKHGNHDKDSWAGNKLEKLSFKASSRAQYGTREKQDKGRGDQSNKENEMDSKDSWLMKRGQERAKQRNEGDHDSKVLRKGKQRSNGVDESKEKHSWSERRGDEREKQRKNARKSEWLFDRARQREGSRHENERSNRYATFGKENYQNEHYYSR